MKYRVRVLSVLFCLFFIFTGKMYGQTPGLIIKPATGSGAAVLDPNGDGYASENSTGYVANDYDPSETELDMVALVRPDPIGDPIVGPTGSFNEIVGIEGSNEYAIFTYLDASDNFIVRFRLDGYAPNSKSYAIFIDTDEKFGFTGPGADPNAISGNPGFEIELTLHTNFTVDVYDIDGVVSSTPSASYSYDTNCQKSIALSTNSGDPDYFYDFFVPYSALTALGVTTSTAMRFVAVTTMNPNQAIDNNALSDVGGENTDSNTDQTYLELIDTQTPTPPGEEVLDRSECPTITTPVSNGATSVSGTTSEADLTAIEVFVNDVSIGTTTSSGGSWTLTGIGPLNAGEVVTATATAPNKGTSVNTCNLSFVGSDCSPAPQITPIDNGDKGVSITMDVSNFPVGTVFTVYANGIEWVKLNNQNNPVDNNPYTIDAADITAGTIEIGCGGSGGCLDDGVYSVTAAAPSECESQEVYFCVRQNNNSPYTLTTAPAIDVTDPYSSVVTGTSGISGATLYLFADGIQIAQKILNSTGAWSLNVDPSEICNVSLTAKQIENGLCISDPSTAVLVGEGTTSAPVIDLDVCLNSISNISGFSSETDGTIIQVYVNGTPEASTTTVSGGAWSYTLGTAAGIGDAITATAENTTECKGVSALSTAVSLGGTTTLSGTFSISSTIYDTTDPVPVDYSGLSASTSYTINLEIDGYAIGSTTFTSSGTGAGTVNISPDYAGDLYVGGALSISLQEAGKCASGSYDLAATVQCATPSFATSTISAVLSDKCVDTSGEISITNSESLVIYTPVDISGNTQGYSTLGNGGTISVFTYPFASTGTTTFYIKAERISSVTCELQSTASVSFDAFDSPVFSTQPLDQTVCSGSSASIPVAWSGTGPFDIQWQYNNGGGFMDLAEGGIYTQAVVSGTSSTSSALLISDVTGLDGYSFQCIVTDLGVPSDCESTTSNSSTFSVPLVIISSSTVTNSTNGSNGAISITPSGGDGNYSFDWHHIDGTGDFDDVQNISGLAGGTYTVTVRDENLCTYEESFTVGGIGSINLATVSSTNITCFGADDGAFEVAASTGTAPYTYSIDDFATSQASGVFTGLSAGTYTVKAQDSNTAESNSVSITITEPLEIIVYASISNPSVALNDGSITGNIVGGTANFDVSLYEVGTPDELISTISNTSSRTPGFTNLTEGTYYMLVSDANGCSSTSANIVLTAPTVTPIQCTHTATHTFNDGSYAGYDGSFNYFSGSWTETNDTENYIKLLNGTLVLGNHPSGSGEITISQRSVYRNIDLLGATNISISYDYYCVNSVPQDNYTIEFLLNDVVQDTYTINSNNQYVLGTNPYNQTITGATFNTTSGNSTNKVEFRITGTARSNFRIDAITVTFDKTLNTGTVSTPATCDNGTIDLSVSGGYSPYTYDWDTDGTGDYDDAQDLSGLSTGTYIATVQDASGACISAPISVTITSAPLSVSVTSTNPTCAGGGSNGTVTATIDNTGGGGPFTYELIKGVSESISTVSSASTSKTFSGLGVGSYKVIVTQALDACTAESSSTTLTLPSVSASIASTGATTICEGGSTTVAVTVTGGTSPYTVVLSNGLKTETNYISGADITITPPASTTVTISSVTDAASCVSTNSGSVPITITPLPTAPTSATADRLTVCSDDTGNITLTASGGSGTTLQWYTGSCGGTSIGSGNDLTVASPSSTTTYYVSYQNSCGESSCASVTVTVTPQATVSSHPADVTVSDGSSTSFSVTASNATGYQWMVSTDNGSNYSNLSNDATYSGVTTATLSVNATNAMDSYWYVCAISSTSCSLIYSDPAILTVTPNSPVITTQPSTTTVCDGDAASFTVVATGATSYQWQVDTGSGFGDISDAGVYSGSTTATLAISNSTGLHTYAFRVNVTNAGGTTTSSSATLNVNTVSAGTIGSDQTVCPSGDPAAFTESVAASGTSGGTLTYQWQSKTTGAYSDISGADQALYDPPSGLTETTTYSRVVTNTLNGVTCSATSNEIVVTIDNSNTFTISSQPADTDVCETGSTTISISTDGSGGRTYQWYDSNDIALSGSPYSGETSSTLTITDPALALSGEQYYVIVTETTCLTSVTSTNATLTVNANPVTTYTMEDGVLCDGSTTTLTLSGSELNVDYQLRDDSDDSSIGSPVSGTGGSIGFTGLAPSAFTTYNVLASNASCSVELTDKASISIASFNAVVWDITESPDSTAATPSNSSSHCPDLIAPDFNPDNNSYTPGVSIVDVRIDRELSTADWEFDYDVSGATVSAIAVTGDVTGTIVPSPSTPNISAGSNSYIYIRLKIENTPGFEQNVVFSVDNVKDINNPCDETGGTGDNSITHIIETMPVVGPFN